MPFCKAEASGLVGTSVRAEDDGVGTVAARSAGAWSLGLGEPPGPGSGLGSGCSWPAGSGGTGGAVTMPSGPDIAGGGSVAGFFSGCRSSAGTGGMEEEAAAVAESGVPEAFAGEGVFSVGEELAEAVACPGTADLPGAVSVSALAGDGRVGMIGTTALGAGQMRLTICTRGWRNIQPTTVRKPTSSRMESVNISTLELRLGFLSLRGVPPGAAGMADDAGRVFLSALPAGTPEPGAPAAGPLSSKAPGAPAGEGAISRLRSDPPAASGPVAPNWGSVGAPGMRLLCVGAPVDEGRSAGEPGVLPNASTEGAPGLPERAGCRAPQMEPVVGKPWLGACPSVRRGGRPPDNGEGGKGEFAGAAAAEGDEARPPSKVWPRPGCCQAGEGSCKGLWGVSALGKRPAPPVSPKLPSGLLGGGVPEGSFAGGVAGEAPPNIPAKLLFSPGRTKLEPPPWAAPGTGAVDSPVGKGLPPPGPKPAGGKRLPAPAGAAGGTVETGGNPESPPPGSEVRGGKGLVSGPDGVGKPPPKAEPGKAPPV